MVGGLDGTAALSGRVGELSTPTDARLFKDLRALPDLVLVGASTVRQERYGPVRLEGRAGPPVAVVSRSLAIDWDLPMFTQDGPRPLVITCASSPAERREEAGRVADVIVTDGSSVDLSAALAELRGRGFSIVLCEGGPTLLGELAASGLLDELCLSLSPVMGGDPLPLAVSPAGAALTRFELRHCLTDEDGTVFLRYERR
jgi:riboflavin biosynthesis pyrimidine reductase